MTILKKTPSKATFLEKPLEYVHHSSADVVQNWYKARAYVLDLICRQLDQSEGQISCWNFIVVGDSSLMLAVVRHLALYAHFTMYEERDYDGNHTRLNQTVITLVTEKKAEDIEAELRKEDNLCNLPEYCKMTIFGNVQNEDSYIDIAIEVVRKTKEGNQSSTHNVISITEEDVLKWCATQDPASLLAIDTRKALYVNAIYNLGGSIDNLKYEDINNTKRYAKALDVYQYRVLKDSLFNGDGKYKKLINEKWKNNYNAVRDGMSNIICADCLEIREKEVIIKVASETKNGKAPKDAWQKYIVELSQCEHNRWVVEKLISGFHPLDKKEIFKYERLFGNQRKMYLAGLKKRLDHPCHMDICPNEDMRRLDPDNMKYDSFLMLAVPLILKEIREENKRFRIKP